MNIEELKELIELISEKGFAEFEIEREGFRLRISRFKEPEPIPAQSVTPPVIITAPMTRSGDQPASAVTAEAVGAIASGPGTIQADTRAVTGERKPDPSLHLIKSPIVGTFYRAPSPTSDPFVKIGNRVEPESIVCIVEAMKLMNEIQAEVSGEIVEIYVENGQPVEFGQPMFGVRK